MSQNLIFQFCSVAQFSLQRNKTIWKNSVVFALLFLIQNVKMVIDEKLNYIGYFKLVTQSLFSCTIMFVKTVHAYLILHRL